MCCSERVRVTATRRSSKGEKSGSTPRSGALRLESPLPEKRNALVTKSIQCRFAEPAAQEAEQASCTARCTNAPKCTAGCNFRSISQAIALAGRWPTRFISHRAHRLVHASTHSRRQTLCKSSGVETIFFRLSMEMRQMTLSPKSRAESST